MPPEAASPHLPKSNTSAHVAVEENGPRGPNMATVQLLICLQFYIVILCASKWCDFKLSLHNRSCARQDNSRDIETQKKRTSGWKHPFKTRIACQPQMQTWRAPGLKTIASLSRIQLFDTYQICVVWCSFFSLNLSCFEMFMYVHVCIDTYLCVCVLIYININIIIQI